MNIYNAIMGLVVGDALGVPVEFSKRDTYNVNDMIGYGTYNQPPGTWSDDSSMILATIESLGRLGKIDTDDIMKNFYKWLHDGEFTPYGNVFDVGMATNKAIEKYAQGVAPLECGGKMLMDNGNGSLMRILPIAFIPHDVNDIYDLSMLTHAHDISLYACRIYIDVAEQLIKGRAIDLILKDIRLQGFYRLPTINQCTRDEIKSSGYVVDTLEAALWCLTTTSNYRDCVITAVNLGEDTDTVAAVAGGLAGIVYGCGGEKGIPNEWIDEIPRKDWIKGLCDKLDKSFK